MSSRIGRMLSVEIFGERHGKAVGVTIDGLPAGLRLDMEKLNTFVQRRAARSAIARVLPSEMVRMVSSSSLGVPFQ